MLFIIYPNIVILEYFTYFVPYFRLENLITENLSEQSTKQVKYFRITILGYIINTIYELPAGDNAASRK